MNQEANPEVNLEVKPEAGRWAVHLMRSRRRTFLLGPVISDVPNYTQIQAARHNAN